MLSCLWDDAYKKALLLIGKNSPCDGSKFPLTICVVLYHRSDAIGLTFVSMTDDVYDTSA